MNVHSPNSPQPSCRLAVSNPLAVPSGRTSRASTIVGNDEQRDVVRVQRIFRWTIAACGLIYCWICRFWMNSDGVSYLDMGDQYWKGNWRDALSGSVYWSPLYAWITGLMFRLTKPSMRWEYPEVHLLNCAILVAALFCFEFFWRELLTRKGENNWTGASLSYAWALGYLLFACIYFGVDELALVTPDLLVAALVLLASGMLLRFADGRTGTMQAALMGMGLGVGYLAKTAMLPFAVVVMVTMLAVAYRYHGKKWLVGVALLSFLTISVPFIAALSLSEHRFTFGDSAKLNQGWLVNGVNPSHWQGDGPGHADALHPTRMIFRWPEVYEFATPVAGTYPVWYDPSYWYAGLDSRVHPLREVKAFLVNIYRIDKYLVGALGFLTAVTLMMFLLSDRLKDSWRQLTDFWPILIPAGIVFLMYAMVCWEQRYTSGVMLVGCGAVMASMSILEEERRLNALRAASLVLGAMVVCWVLPQLLVNISYRDGGQSARQVVVAEELRVMGIEPGDHVALIGDGLSESSWARLEKAKIVAEVTNNSESGDSEAAFWSSGLQGEQAVLSVLKGTGAKAVIADTPPRVLPQGWDPVGSTGHAVYFFR